VHASASRQIVWCLSVLLLFSPPAWAEDSATDPGADPVTRSVQLLQLLEALTALERKDYATAFPLLLPLARAGMPEAQFYVGVMYHFGYGVPRDDREAVRWYRLAAEQGHADAQFNLGVMYAYGEGVPQDHAEALRWFRLAAEQGDAKAQFNLGVMYDEGEGVPQDHAEALRWFRLAAEQGVAEAQFNLGVMYHKGEGVPQDHAEALRWFRLAAEQGHAKAQFNLGVMYDKGEGVPQDHAEALRWYRLAAEQGHANAQFNLGVMYHKGEGVPQDHAEALRWYRLAAEQGDADAQVRLGMMYHNGEGVPQDHAEALRWFRLAAEQGHAFAMALLGLMYEFGAGVRRDLVEAHKWYNLAAARMSDPEARELSVRNRERVAALLDPPQLAEAQRRARQWRPGPSTPAPPSPAAPSASGVDRATVREVQRLLARLGFDPGPADGIVGAQTRSAVRAFERSRGLPETGVVDARLLALLRAIAATPATPVPQSTKSPSSSSEPAANSPRRFTGSGFWVSDRGHVLTNRHVAESCQQLIVRDAGGASHEARLLALGHEDLALLDARAEPLAVAVFRDGEWGLLGEPVVTYGFPLSGLLASAGNLGTGTVAALAGPLDDAALLQITAPVQAGNSGGPVLDTKGRVIGVIVAKLDAVKVASVTGDLPQNVNFAIKAPVAVGFLRTHGVDPTVTPFGWDMRAAELADYARAISVRVDCLR
jgi:TPR repeat protein